MSPGNATREAIAASARRATETGRSRWLVHRRVHEGDAAPASEAPARALALWRTAGGRDRFYWEHVESGHVFCAVGNVDETESSGPSRFADVRRWLEERCARLDFVGAASPWPAPLALGGFAFDDDGPTTEPWKGFPAARFVMPEQLFERRGDAILELQLVRVEPGASVAQLESALAERATASADVDDGDPGRESASGVSTAAECEAARASSWPPGPEYRVQSDRAHDVFRAQVRKATEEIATGGLEKVVLARSLRVEHDGAVDVADFLARLRAIYPSCTLVAMGRGSKVFLAATPETLVRVEGRRVATAALAGSAPRGRTPEEDAEIGRALLASAKDRAEHAHVVHAIRSVLDARCDRLEMADAPRLRPLFGIQHLETPFVGRLAQDGAATGVLELVEALHPTPAVGGTPAAAARRFLARVEGLDRGWYAAPIGWLDAEGGGDFRVALRSALIDGVAGAGEEPVAGSPPPEASSRALLFAGVGLVAGSDPERELEETRIKLRALLAPLTEI